jgi:transposase
MGKQAYPDDMTDKEWELIRPFLEQNGSPRGRKNKICETRSDECNILFDSFRMQLEPLAA